MAITKAAQKRFVVVQYEYTADESMAIRKVLTLQECETADEVNKAIQALIEGGVEPNRIRVFSAIECIIHLKEVSISGF
jgi:hypothetical protein